MADPVLHIKDSYYFEVPKALYPYEYRRRQQFPDVWISLDPQFQEWEAERLYAALKERDAGLPPKDDVLHEWHHWTHANHSNFAKPLDVFLDEKYQAQIAKFNTWKVNEIATARAKRDGTAEEAKRLDFGDYLKHLESAETGHKELADHEYIAFYRWRNKNSAAFERAKTDAGNIREWKADKSVPEWNEVKLSDGRIKLDAYNGQLAGKILIPQPFATLRNLYEKESGFAISKYLLIEIFVGLVLVLLFSRFAAKIKDGRPPKGKFWNLIETFLLFIRNEVAHPTLGGHHEEDADQPEHGHEYGGPYAEHGQATNGHGHHRADVKAHVAEAVHHHHEPDPANRFLPLLWTIFFFVLGCNLMGMVPWAGAPTAAFAVTLAMAAVTFVAVVIGGIAQFGVGGFFLNQIPGMDLPWYMAMVIKPMILAIELLGLCIKHGVLAVRLLANMVAGHLVLLAIMGFAFGAEAAATFSAPGAGWQWYLIAPISVLASAALSCLELFVAFLQAYIFTFLTALFIGAAIHKH